MTSEAIQIDAQGELQHFIQIEGLTRKQITDLLDKAESFIQNGRCQQTNLCHGKTIVNLFCEDSTRTRLSFELATKLLGANYLRFDVQSSSLSKGETLIDSINTLHAMGVDAVVVRHKNEGTAGQLARYVGDHMAIINAGDGMHAHPTQALLDMLTIRKNKGSFKGLKVAMIGDVRHSRVARSHLCALKILGVNDIRLIAPQALLDDDATRFANTVTHDIEAGLRDVDVIVCLRIQKERIQTARIPDEKTFMQDYGLTQERLNLAAHNAIVMHPGPINREVEIASEVADGPQSVIQQQVRNGVAVRMALLHSLLN